MDIEDLVLRIKVMAEQADIAIDEVKEGLEKLDTANKQSGDTAKQASHQAQQAYRQQGQSAEAASAQTIAAYTAIAAVATQTFRIIINSIEKSIDANNRYIASVQGLQSVSTGRGIGGDSMQAALDGLTDAFFDTTAAATSLKNLLSRGYTLDQAVQTITRLKDAAAFGRQASYGLAQAVQSATEGLKNENSVLVDNSGVTKNVAKMWEDYAKAHGLVAANLSTSQKIEAEYQGILSETAFQVGDLAKLTSTLAGAQAEAAMSEELLSRSYGESMTPTVGLATEAWNEFLLSVRRTVDLFPELAAGATTATLSITGFVIAGSAAASLKKLYDSLQLVTFGTTTFGVAVKTAMPWLLAVSAAIGIATAAYTAIVNAQERAAKATEESAKRQREEQEARKNAVDELQTLGDRYDVLSKKKRLSYSETRELRGIEQQLSEKYGITVDALGNLAGAYDTVAAAIRNKRAETLAEMQETLDNNLDIAKQAQEIAAQEADKARFMAKAIGEIQNAYDELKKSKQDVSKVDLTLNNEIKSSSDPARIDLLKRALFLWRQSRSELLVDFDGTMKSMQDGVDGIIAAESNAYLTTAKAAADKVEASIGAIDISAAFKAKMRGILESLDYSGGINAEGFIQKYADVLKNSDITPALAAMEEMKSKITQGLTISESDQQKYKSSYDALYQALLGQDQKRFLPSYESDWKTFFDKITNGMFDVQDRGEAWTTFWDSIAQDSIKAIKSMSGEDAAKGMTDLQTQVKAVADGYSNVAERIKDIKTAMTALDSIQTAGASGTLFANDKVQAWAQAVYDATGVVITSYADVERAQQNLGAMTAAANADWTQQALAQAAAEESIQRWITALTEQRAELDATGQEYQTLTGQIDTLTAMLAVMSNAASSVGTSFSTGSSTTFDPLTASAEEYQAEIAKVVAKVDALKKSIKMDQAAAENVRSWRKIAQAAKDGTATQEEFNAMLEAAGIAAKSPEEAIGILNSMAASISGSMGLAKDEITGLIPAISALIAAVNKRGDIKIDTSGALGAINTIVNAYNAFAKSVVGRFLGLSPIGTKSSGGGGGGQSAFSKDIAAMTHEVELQRMSLEQELQQLEALQAKYRNKRGASTLSLDDQRDLEQRLFDVREEIRKRDLDAEYDALDHRKALGQLTVQEEIAQLEAIKAAHQLNAEELADIDERLYDAREALRQEQYQADMAVYNHRKNMGELTVQQELDMLQSIINAHHLSQDELWSMQEQMYALQQQQQQEAQQAQEAALQAQTSAVQRAYRQIVAALKNRLQEEKDAELAALDDRIDMLRAQTDAEEEVSRVQDYEETLADKQRQLRTTKSARERRELQQEIDDLVADEQRRQDQLARQAEIDALQDEKTAVSDKYAQLMDEENLRQEALRVVMSNNLQQMADLIASYGSVWEDAGATLAERLTSGFAGGSIMATIENLVSGMNAAVDRQLEQIANSIPSVRSGGITVNMYGLTVREEADAKRIAEYMMDEIDRKSR